jgi:hypothetical protein
MPGRTARVTSRLALPLARLQPTDALNSLVEQLQLPDMHQRILLRGYVQDLNYETLRQLRFIECYLNVFERLDRACFELLDDRIGPVCREDHRFDCVPLRTEANDEPRKGMRLAKLDVDHKWVLPI